MFSNFRKAGMSKKQKKPLAEETYLIEVSSTKSSYYISKHVSPDPYYDGKTDDEYIFDVVGKIIKSPKRHSNKHLKQECEISLLSAIQYIKGKDIIHEKEPHFFGNMTLRGQQRGGLVYLPNTRLMHIEHQIRASVFKYIEITSEYLERGHGSVISINFSEDIPTEFNPE